MSLPETLTRRLAAHAVEGTILVAVSGGADSVALLHALTRIPRPRASVRCAHVNHKLRGRESEDDEAFVRELCQQLAVPLDVLEAVPDRSDLRRTGVEAAARRARYAALETLRTSTGSDWIVTAHTRDDQAETVLLRLLTRASIESLGAIRPVKDQRIIRPLLETSRAELREWLARHDLTWRDDSSNLDVRYLRNRIRRNLLPQLLAIDPAVPERLGAIAEHVRRIDEFAQPALTRVEKEWMRTALCSRIEAARLPHDPDLRRLALLSELERLNPGGREVSGDRLATLIDETDRSWRVSLGDSLRASLTAGQLSLERMQAVPPFHHERVGVGTLDVPEIGIRVTIEPGEPSSPLTGGGGTIQLFTLEAGSAPPRFEVRNRRPGDRFQPLGMASPKKLKDVLINRKVPAAERDRLPLLVHDGEIVWIPGVEVSETCRVRPGRHLYRVRIDYLPSREEGRGQEGV